LERWQQGEMSREKEGKQRDEEKRASVSDGRVPIISSANMLDSSLLNYQSKTQIHYTII
jgi:hypothetical protein